MAVSMYKHFLRPGLFLESVGSGPAFALETGVPLFIGLMTKADLDSLESVPAMAEIGTTGMYRIRPMTSEGEEELCPRFTSQNAFNNAFSHLGSLGFLFTAVRGFFENGGKTCRVYPLGFDTHRATALTALSQALSDSEALTDIDLVSVPDAMWLFQQSSLVSIEDLLAMQNRILDHCRLMIGRFAVLDTFPGADTQAAVAQRKKLVGDSGALYYPWLQTLDQDGQKQLMVPPCGYVCGIYARCDNHTGVHKAPANEDILGVTDLDILIGNDEQDVLNPEHVNCIRSFPGRGIRIWGARTLSRYPEWMYVNVRRLFLTLSRWLEAYMVNLVFEPNDASLWGRVNREINAYLESLYLKGALKGETAKDAFFVRCDNTTNTSERRDLGQLVTEIGLAPAAPCEFILIRIIHSDSGTQVVQASDNDMGIETPTTIPDSPILSGIVISHIEYTVPGRDVDGEYVLIENTLAHAVDLGNWTLRDHAGHVFRFPLMTLAAGSTCRVWTGAGTDTASDVFWGRGTAVWNNEGDRAILRNRHGLTVHTYEYVP